ncbi:MAG: class I SAM-dependent methyltransferase [Acidimicrobiales bacterium]
MRGRSDADDPRIEPAARAFGPAATDYERARPTYPSAAIDTLRTRLGIGPGMRVCDLAAGTGKLTRLLVETGADVVAVEPVLGMRVELTAQMPDVDVLDGTAEDLPFDDGSLDVVTVAQAFHWFRFDEALGEIRRVLRPGGGLAILFNERDERAGWVRAWNDAIEWHSRRIAYYQRTDWGGVLRAAGYVHVGHDEVEWAQPMTRDLVASRVRSVSYVAELDAAGQQEYVDRVAPLVADFDEPFALPYVTHLHWATRS